jgi:hypothetical protein
VRASLPESVVKMKQTMGPELLKNFAAEKRSSRLQVNEPLVQRIAQHSASYEGIIY